MASYKKLVERLELLACRFNNKPNGDLIREIYMLLHSINENGQDANHLRILMIELEKCKDKAEKQKEIGVFITTLSELYSRFDFRKKPLHIGIVNYLWIFLITTAAAVVAEVIVRIFLEPAK